MSFFAIVMTMTGCASSHVRERDLRLIRAAERGQTQEMHRLISAGADINARDEEGWTPYLAASTMGQFEAMKLLKSLGAKTDAYETETGFDPSYLADK